MKCCVVVTAAASKLLWFSWWRRWRWCPIGFCVAVAVGVSGVHRPITHRAVVWTTETVRTILRTILLLYCYQHLDLVADLSWVNDEILRKFVHQINNSVRAAGAVPLYYWLIGSLVITDRLIGPIEAVFKMPLYGSRRRMARKQQQEEADWPTAGPISPCKSSYAP